MGWPENFANVDENLLKTPIFDYQLIQDNSNADVLSSISKAFNLRRPRLFAHRVAIFQALQETSSEDKSSARIEALTSEPIAQTEKGYDRVSKTRPPEKLAVDNCESEMKGSQECQLLQNLNVIMVSTRRYNLYTDRAGNLGFTDLILTDTPKKANPVLSRPV